MERLKRRKRRSGRRGVKRRRLEVKVASLSHYWEVTAVEVSFKGTDDLKLGLSNVSASLYFLVCLLSWRLRA
jgi:hypothetical protein